MFGDLVTWFGGQFGTSGDKLAQNISIPLRFDKGSPGVRPLSDLSTILLRFVHISSPIPFSIQT